MLYSPVCPIPLAPDSPFADNPAGYVGMGWGVRKWPRAEDRLLFEDDVPDANGLPGIRISYEVTEREQSRARAGPRLPGSRRGSARNLHRRHAGRDAPG